jgi:hypothetical protein
MCPVLGRQAVNPETREALAKVTLSPDCHSERYEESCLFN